LQHLLTHSFSAKALAVKRVTENPGKRTSGVDRELWNTSEKKAQGIQSLQHPGYRAQPLRSVYIPKGDSGTKMRPLGIPTMKDRAFQMLHKLALDPIAETTGDPNAYGFREGRSAADAIGQCFICFCRKDNAQWILEADIQACFDEISHKWLLDNIPMNKRILSQWLKAGIIDRNIFRNTKAGTPQGAPISPVLANLTLDGLERTLRQNLPATTAEGANPKVNLVRFADDFIVTSSSKTFLEDQVKPLITQFLQERGLTLSPHKTTITHIDQGFDFLGQNIRKYQGKLLIKPAPKRVKAFLTRVRSLIQTNPQSTAGQLITQLNPLIRGWGNYHRHVVSKRVFRSVDHYIWQALWQWAKRRHPNKSRDWIKHTYFGPSNGRKWDFFGFVTTQQGQSQQVQLVQAADIPIRRHGKIRAQANPFDPHWELYFEQRLETKMKTVLKDNHRARRLWLDQQGLCPICRQKITTQTGWQCHHIIWRVHGGDNSLQNQVLLHPNCHLQVHSQGWTVVKPRPSSGVTKA